MFTPLTIALGKSVKAVARLRHGGSAFPGLVVEKLDPHLLARILNRLPHGVVVISGTNGKTTTTKIVVELLRACGLKVFTNDTGSNFVRGVLASLLDAVDLRGNLDADIAVLELDEAHAVRFIELIRPRHTLLLNVMRDQLDRFGEVDYTASLLAKIAEATTTTLVTNRHDSRLRALGERLRTGGDLAVHYFGLSDQLAVLFPEDDQLRATATTTHTPLPSASVILEALVEPHGARFCIGEETYEAHFQLQGLYNLFNAAAALALVREILPEHLLNDAHLVAALSQVRAAFGRGETLTINGDRLELVLVKNPAGFRLALTSFPAAGVATMIAINDAHADGRDMSWLWDVDFDVLRDHGVEMVSGIRAYDMALRLYYNDVEVDKISTDLRDALTDFLAEHPGRPKRIFCSYTAMLALRKHLGELTDVEVAIK
ncbi:MAG: MurT ligase domain-containing protein [Bowdeniella nasicola]|nr:MurT ligase domain-containing protein [Bowdeniella nasicola]